MKVVEHTQDAFDIYKKGNPDGTISLWRKMVVVEADYSFIHQTLQGGSIKWLSESFLKAVTFKNVGVIGPEKTLEYRITLELWSKIRDRAVPQQGAPHGAIQYNYEGLYKMNTTQGGPFMNFGIPPDFVATFNAGLREVGWATPYVYPNGKTLPEQ